jgi:hypothetical protein
MPWLIIQQSVDRVVLALQPFCSVFGLHRVVVEVLHQEELVQSPWTAGFLPRLGFLDARSAAGSGKDTGSVRGIIHQHVRSALK